MPKCIDLKLTRKSTITYKIDFTKDRIATNITGWTVYLTIKTFMEDTDAQAKLAKVVTSFANPLAGIALIALTTSETNIPAGNYWYSIDYKKDDGNEGIVVTGKIKIAEPVLQDRS